MVDALRFYTLADIAELLGTSVDRVGDMVRCGDLAAVDIGSVGARRRTWRVSAESLAQFLARRATQSPPPKQRRRRRSGYCPLYY